ncbi:uncharacterized protein [Primulina huaijiensis]|uniref:uncharacterized protein n=1 Tax=Primulina huaijiensis TaxID=1492673 RepID=UPI003CC712BC
MRRRVSLSPAPTIYPNHGGSGVATGKSRENKKGSLKMWTFNRSRFSPARLMRQIGTKVEVALWFVTSSRKVSSATFAKSRSYAEKLDCQQAEAIEDCIDFFNSFSSLQRSNSVSSTC